MAPFDFHAVRPMGNVNHHEGQAHAARAGDSEPRVRVAQASCARHEAGWRMGWRITNLTSSGMRLLDARFPHGRFRSGLIQLADVRVAPSESAEVEAVVVCNGGLGDVVENAFLITTVEWRRVPWRILARMTVRFGAEGAPTAVTELVTVQQVGFSGSRCQVQVSKV